jgi:hypothetical protein
MGFQAAQSIGKKSSFDVLDRALQPFKESTVSAGKQLHGFPHIPATAIDPICDGIFDDIALLCVFRRS